MRGIALKSRSGRVTIQHVADEAGVSIATVSRVLNGDEKVTAERADKVRAVAARLGYRPFGAARDLASGNHRSIGAIVPDLGNPYFYDVIKATTVGAAGDGFRMVISDSGDDADLELSIAQERLSQVDGLLILSSRIDVAGLRSLMGQSAPVLLVNRIERGVDLPVVAVDNFSAMLELCHDLAELGHRRIVYLSGSPRAWQNRERWRAIEQARIMGIEATSVPVDVASIEGGYRATDEALTHSPTAIVAFNDLVACGVLTRLRERGIRVPEEMSVTGFDDIVFAQHTQPSLTTARSPRAELGDQAWRMMQALIAGERLADPPLLKAAVILRGSTGPAAR
jgi:LacI family transcriptional regulator